MKKVFSHITSNMIRPILYQCVTKSVFALAMLLLWDRFVNPLGIYLAVRDGFFIIAAFSRDGVVFLSVAGWNANAENHSQREEEKNQKQDKRCCGFCG